MLWVCLALIPISLLISLPMTALLVRVSHRFGAFDSAGVAGQVKAQRRKIPNTGGIAIFLGVWLPIAVGLALINLTPVETIAEKLPALAPHLAGISFRTPMASVLLGCLLILHILGLVDDRKPLGPYVKLVLMVGVATLAVVGTGRVGTGSRLLTFIDPYVGGPWLSMILSIVWIVVVTNAMNFLDNMDGLSAGVGAIAAACFLAGTLAHPQPQWFIASCLALLIGSLVGFLIFNFPPAKIFMGDGGSLVLGFLLAFLTVRTTYYDSVTANPAAGGWYSVFMPLVVLAVPLYDFISVVVIRLSQGRSPFVGDLQHVSHRFVGRGLSRPAAVLVIWGLTGVTGIGGIYLASLRPWQAMLVAVQIVMALVVLAAFERASDSRKSEQNGRPPGPA